MTTAAALFGATALGGVLILVLRLRGAPRPPFWLAWGHGIFALGGFVSLFQQWQASGLPALAQWGSGVLAAAALGGVSLAGLFHLRQRELPVPMILGHGLVALVGLGLLILGALQG